MWSNKLTFLLVLAGGTVAYGCGGDAGPTGPRTVASVEIAAPPGPLASFGEVVNLTVTVRDQDGAPISTTVTWSSLDPAIATANADGSIVAVANGSASVTATASGVSDTVTIVVEQQPASVQISPGLPVLELVGDTLVVVGQTVDARGHRMENAGAVTWSATGAVTIQPTGTVTATGFGVGTVTATAGGISSSARVEVIGDRFFLSNGTRMRYDIDLPNGSGGPFPAIIWVHGSGQLDRNTQKGATDPLVPAGMAVLRYDKRGVGESGGTFGNVSPANSVTSLGILADDAANAVRFLARRAEIDTTRIGIMGNSQAGWIVPMAAVRARNIVSYMMLWSGPTISVGLEIFYSNVASNPATPLDSVYARLGEFNGVPGYDALSDLTSLDIPGLWQYGELDRSIPMRLDVQRLNTLRSQGKPFEVVTWPFGDHALRDTRVNQFYDVWSEYLRFLRANGILGP